jgi:hypothetical protein
VSPVCLPIKDDDYHSKYNGTVTRWVSVLDSRGNDSSNKLQKAQLPMISLPQCSLQNKYSGHISENHICTKSCQVWVRHKILMISNHKSQCSNKVNLHILSRETRGAR